MSVPERTESASLGAVGPGQPPPGVAVSPSRDEMLVALDDLLTRFEGVFEAAASAAGPLETRQRADFLQGRERFASFVTMLRTIASEERPDPHVLAQLILLRATADIEALIGADGARDLLSQWATITQPRVRRGRPRKNPSATEKRVKELSDSGKSLRQIQKELGLASPAAVRAILERFR